VRYQKSRFLLMVMNKRGASHFEMIISFIFFVGFVFFLFLFLKPYDTTVLSGSVVAALYDTFEEEVHTNLTSLFLKAEHDVPTECFKISLPGYVFAYSFSDSRVTTLADDLKDSKLDEVIATSNGDLSIDASDIFYKVFISPEFETGSLGSCPAFVPAGTEPYIIGSKIERRVISYGALEKMKADYNGDYEVLKADLRIPDSFDFFIVSEDLDLEMKRFVPDSIEKINTRDYILEVLKSDGTTINARFTIGVW
jgi:hypothetical protein